VARKVTVLGCVTSSLFVAFTAWIGNCARTPSASLPSNTSCRLHRTRSVRQTTTTCSTPVSRAIRRLPHFPAALDQHHPSGSTALARIISGADGLPGGPAGPIKPSPAGRKQPPGRNRPIVCGAPRARRAARHLLNPIRDRLWHDSRLLFPGVGSELGSAESKTIWRSLAQTETWRQGLSKQRSSASLTTSFSQTGFVSWWKRFAYSVSSRSWSMAARSRIS
jgi:hypothetical protein